MNAETAKAIADHLIGALEYEINTTTGVFAAVPADKLSYTPHHMSKTAIGILLSMQRLKAVESMT